MSDADNRFIQSIQTAAKHIGIFCKKIDKYNFICSDGIVEFNMKIEDMLNESEKTFICKNTQFGISFEHFVFGSAVKERNLFYLNLDNINEI